MGIGFRELLVILVIVLLIFGAKRLRSIGSDFGAAVKNFRSSMKEGEKGAVVDDDEKTVRAEDDDKPAK
jgi:sec-independent protein translocase protein TatA